VTTYPPLLSGLRVLDLSHQYAGALAGSLLGDLGADVVVVEHPTKRGSIRTMLPRRDAESMWWKVMARGKETITLDLGSPEGRDLLLKMVGEFDVLIENFRPGTLEKWGLGPTDLEAAGADLAMLRISGFGQTGPARNRPGFGSAAEAISGFAHLTGDPDGPPVFPSVTLADGVTGVFGAFGLMAALASRRSGTPGPKVEVVDIALFESLFRIIPSQVAGYDQCGYVPKRPGNSLISHGSLRNLYTTSDGRHFIVASVGPQTIRRIVQAVEAPELAAEIDAGIAERTSEEFMGFLQRCDDAIRTFAEARPYADVVAALTAHDAVFQAVYSMEDIVKDEQFHARGDLIRVPDEDFGDILMQGIMPKFHSRDHEVTSAGKGRGRDNKAVYERLLGLTEADLERLSQDHVI